MNVIISAKTSDKAQKVVLRCETKDTVYGTWNMSSTDSLNWTFNANSFYEQKTFLITVTAYFDNDVEVTNTLNVNHD